MSDVPAKPLIEMHIIIRSPGVQLATTVGITEVTIKELMGLQSPESALHEDLVKAARTGVEILARQYNGMEVLNAAQEGKV